SNSSSNNDDGSEPNVVCPDFHANKNVYFGDLHTHTSYSFDAYDFGTRSDPSLAYAFAKGQNIDIAPTADPGVGQSRGPTITINFSAKKLDFLAVTDHAEFLGSQEGCTDPKSGFYDNPYCQRIRSAVWPNFEDENSPSNVLHSPCLGQQANGAPTAACVN